MKKPDQKPKIIVVGQPGINPAELVRFINRQPIAVIDPRKKTGSFTGVASGGKK